jgi:hypothetical protein
MNPRQASLRSSHRSAAPVHSKRPASDDDTTSKKSRTSKKSKKSSSVAANKPDIFPSYELLTKLSDPETYQRALLVKQEQKRELVDLDQLLTATAYGTSGDQRADPKDRLLSVLRWKLLRGQFRPTLPALVAQNSSEEVIRRVDKALDLLANCQTVDQAIQSDATKTMCELRGVGPATAAGELLFLYLACLPLTALRFEKEKKRWVVTWRKMAERNQPRCVLSWLDLSLPVIRSAQFNPGVLGRSGLLLRK